MRCPTIALTATLVSLAGCSRAPVPESEWLDLGPPPDMVPTAPACDGGGSGKGEGRLYIAIEALGPNSARVFIKNISCRSVEYYVHRGESPFVGFGFNSQKPPSGSTPGEKKCSAWNNRKPPGVYPLFLPLGQGEQVKTDINLDYGCPGLAVYGWLPFRYQVPTSTDGPSHSKNFVEKYAGSNLVKFPPLPAP